MKNSLASLADAPSMEAYAEVRNRKPGIQEIIIRPAKNGYILQIVRDAPMGREEKPHVYTTLDETFACIARKFGKTRAAATPGYDFQEESL